MPVDWSYVELEAAREFNYTLGEWMREEVWVKARVIAHWYERNLREAYASEPESEEEPKGRDLLKGMEKFRQGGG